MLTGSVSSQGGGVFQIVKDLSHAIAQREPSVAVFGFRDEKTDEYREKWAPVELFDYKKNFLQALLGWGALTRDLLRSKPNVIHQHGIWNIHLPTRTDIRSSLNLVRVFTPQGMLEPWAMAHHRARKQLLWILKEKRYLNGFDCINVNTEKELANVRALGVRIPACVIPNGVELPKEWKKTGRAPWSEIWNSDRKVLLYLGRLHPKKGIVELVHAWHGASVEGRLRNWRLALFGWDQSGYGAKVNALINELGLSPFVRWFGAAFGDDKDNAFRHANAFILPSYSEGFPMAGLEAWSYSLPLFMTRECNLDIGFSTNAAVELSTGVPGIKRGLIKLDSMTDEKLAATGKRGRALVESQFTWPAVAEEMVKVYRWLLGRGEKPGCVYL